MHCFNQWPRLKHRNFLLLITIKLFCQHLTSSYGVKYCGFFLFNIFELVIEIVAVVGLVVVTVVVLLSLQT